MYLFLPWQICMELWPSARGYARWWEYSSQRKAWLFCSWNLQIHIGKGGRVGASCDLILAHLSEFFSHHFFFFLSSLHINTLCFRSSLSWFPPFYSWCFWRALYTVHQWAPPSSPLANSNFSSGLVLFFPQGSLNICNSLNLSLILSML